MGRVDVSSTPPIERGTLRVSDHGDYPRCVHRSGSLPPERTDPRLGAPASTMLDSITHTDIRPEAMADVPGVCELPLTRAVVQYRERHEVDLSGGRIEDIGMALVLEGRYASRAEAVDLGSADVKELDLSTELVVLDWVYEPTLRHVGRLLSEDSPRGVAEAGSLGSYCFDLALHILRRAGFGPLSRPVILRIGFRDLCRDLDLHEGTSVRISLGRGRLVRAHLDYDANALIFRTASFGPDSGLETALAAAFPGRDMRRMIPDDSRASVAYQIRFPLPLSLPEARESLHSMRLGLTHLVAKFEPTRYRAIDGILRIFGARETLARLPLRPPSHSFLPLPPTGRGATGPVAH